MKRIFLAFVVFPFLLFASFDFSHPESVENLEIFLTKERSGTNWTIAILQILAKKPIALITDGAALASNRLKLELDDAKTPLYRTHKVVPGMTQISPSKNKLLTTLRNYKECLFHKYENPMKLYQDILNDQGNFKQYIDNLIFFDSWNNEQTKLLIYYEDLITEPKENIIKLLNFFDENMDNLDDFLDHYDYWHDRVMESYNVQHNLLSKRKSSSNGDKTVYHSLDMPMFIQKKIDKHIKERYPNLWKKYLQRYES